MCAIVRAHLVVEGGEDLGPDLRCKAGDDVILIGAQNGNEIWADWLGRRAGTIAYEILTAIHPRIPRVYSAASDA